MEQKYIISIDLGGTKILSALIDNSNKIVSTLKIATEIKGGADKLIRSIAGLINKMLANNNLEAKDIKAVSMGVPGTVNPFTGIIASAPNLALTEFNIKEALAKEISIPVLIENDVNLAGLGIKKFEVEDSVKNMLVVFVGTGIGSALFFDGKIFRGSSFYAGEIGHMLINLKGNFNKPKKKITFEETASRPAIVKDIKKGISKNKESLFAEYAANNKIIKSKVLADALIKNDPLVVKQVSKACSTIGTVLASITTLLNIDTIVLGGGVIEAMHEFMLPRIKESFFQSVLEASGKCVNIVETKLGDNAALLGGVALAEEFLSQ